MEKGNKKESTLAWLMGYAGRLQWLTWGSWLLSAVSALVALLPFVFIWEILCRALMGDYGEIVHYGWLAVGAAVASMAVYIIALMCSHIAAFRIAANLRRAALRHILTLPTGMLGMIGTGRTRKTIIEASAATETYLAHQLPDKAGALATPVGLLLLLVWFDWQLGLLSLVPVLLAFVIMSMMTGKGMERKMKEYNDALEAMSNEAVEYVRGISVLKTFGQTVFSFRRFCDSIERYCFWVIGYTKELRLPMVAYTTMINATFAMLIGAALWIAKDGAPTTEFTANLLYYIIVTPALTVTLLRIMYLSENRMVVSDAVERINATLALKPLPEATVPEMPTSYDIEIKSVTFSYGNDGMDALQDVSLRVGQGEHILLVGESGGGKSTLAGLVARMWDVGKGSITIGGIDVKNIAHRDMADIVSFVFQDSHLLKTTILENARMGRPLATQEEVIEALHQAQCDDITEKLPDGIDTVIGSCGVYLSGGETQRVCLARQILKDSPIVILDEATALADPDNEQRIRKALVEVTKGKTVITIAHRLESAPNADKICLLEKGRIVEIGPHCELLAKGTAYASLWNEYGRAANYKLGGTK